VPEVASVILSTNFDVPLNAVVINNKVVAVLDLTEISVNQLSAALDPPGTPIVQSALASPNVLSAVTNFLRQFPLLATPPLMSSTISQPISRGESYGQRIVQNRSLFPPYPTRVTVSLSLGKVVIKPFEGALTVAADFDGITSGDPNRIVNLLKEWSPLVSYVRQRENDGTLSFGATMAGVAGEANLVVLVNAAVFSNVVSNEVSPAFDAGPCIDDKVLIHTVSVGMGWFDAGPPYGTGYGLTIGADLSAYVTTVEDVRGYYWPTSAAHGSASVTVYARMVGVDYGGRLKPGVPAWAIELVNASVGLPDWLPIFLLIPFLCVAVIFPAFIILDAVLALTIGVALPDILSSADSEILEEGVGAFSAASTPVVQTPLFLSATWDQDIRKKGFTSEGAEAHVQLYNPVRVSSLRKNLSLRGLNPAAGLRAIQPSVQAV
jgi:hypothetical protein